jgi:ABC-2 type transport system permease protein
MKPAPTAEPIDHPHGEKLLHHAPAATSLVSSLWALYVLTCRQHLHGRRWIVMTLLFALPIVLAIVIRLTGADAPPMLLEFLLPFLFIPHALLPLVALVYASGIIQDEQEEQTLTYLLMRPIPRWAIYLVKLAATLTTTILLTVIFTTMTYIAIYVGGEQSMSYVAGRCVRAVAIHSLAVSVYCCLFGVMSLMTRWSLIVGILYTGIFEGLLANLPFGIRLITIIYYTRVIAYRSLDFKAKSPAGFEENLGLEVWTLQGIEDPASTEHPTMRTCLIVLAIASVVCAALAAVICARREFHVKTPEGS